MRLTYNGGTILATPLLVIAEWFFLSTEPENKGQ